jgi:DNA-binding MarR family transcriptional regulator
MLVTSIVSGQIISRSGRYKLFPILGTGVMTAGLFLLSRMSAATSGPATAGIILLLGLGLGMVMQVLVLAVQNDVDYADLGVATSGTTLFRLIGGSVGTAVLGAIFASRLASSLAGVLPEGGAMSVSPATLGALSPEVRAVYAAAFTSSLGTAFLVATATAAVGFALAWLLPERPLRETVAASAGDAGADVGETFAMPHDVDSSSQLLRGLAVLADRDVQRRTIEQVVARAGLDLSAAAAWMLVQIDRDPAADPAALADAYRVDAERLRAGVVELGTRGLVSEASGTTDPRRELTDAGRAVLARLGEARRARLEELFADWGPEQRADVARVLARLAHDLVPDGRPGSDPAVAGRTAPDR